MQINQEKKGDVMIVNVEDHLDTAAAPDFERRLLSLVDSGEHKLLVDCSKLQYVNSAGLKVFLLTAKKLEPVKGTMVICSLASSVQMIFDMIGFSRIMNIAPSREEGLRAFSGAAT